jgi:hypothetical protein
MAARLEKDRSRFERLELSRKRDIRLRNIIYESSYTVGVMKNIFHDELLRANPVHAHNAKRWTRGNIRACNPRKMSTVTDRLCYNYVLYIN